MKMSAYIITYTSTISGKRMVFDKIFYTKEKAKNRLVKMWSEHYFKNPRIQKVI